MTPCTISPLPDTYEEVEDLHELRSNHDLWGVVKRHDQAFAGMRERKGRGRSL